MDWFEALFLLLAALTVFERVATYRFAFYGFGLLVWRQRIPSFLDVPSGTPLTSRTHVRRAAGDRLLFQRVSLSWPALQYKGTVQATDDGASVELRVPVLEFLLLALGAVALYAINEDIAGGLMVFAAIPALALVERWLGIRAAQEIIRVATSLTSVSSRTPEATMT